MMQSVLVVIACMSDGAGCQVFPLTQEMPQTMCMSLSQPTAARWAGEHPKHKIERIVCADPRELQNILGRTQA